MDVYIGFGYEKSFEKKMQFQRSRNSDEKANEDNLSIVDPVWETIDPTPDIHSLFVLFDDKFFWKKLQSVEVKWSKRMTSCAGVCSYDSLTTSCIISLSEPLLKLRPRKDLVETLLHEMIHALLFVTHNDKDRDGHGPSFCKHMNRINNQSGSNITIYHNFHDEVRSYQLHWWRCNGPCQYWKPYYGFVKRSMNRTPGPKDQWWNHHKIRCNGTFIKVQEPKKTANKRTTKTSKSKNNILSPTLHAQDTSSYCNKENKNNSENIDQKFSNNKRKKPVSKTASTGSSSENTSNLNLLVPEAEKKISTSKTLKRPLEDSVFNVQSNNNSNKRKLEITNDNTTRKKIKFQTYAIVAENHVNMKSKDDFSTHLSKPVDEENAIETVTNLSDDLDNDIIIIENKPPLVDLTESDHDNNGAN